MDDFDYFDRNIPVYKPAIWGTQSFVLKKQWGVLSNKDSNLLRGLKWGIVCLYSSKIIPVMTKNMNVPILRY